MVVGDFSFLVVSMKSFVLYDARSLASWWG